MPIVRVDLNSVRSARREVRSEGGVKIKTSAEPGKIRKEKVGNQEMLLIDFALKTTYDPDIGEIEVAGTAFYTDEKLESKYTKDKGQIKIAPDVMAEVAQMVFIQPAILAINLARELRLPLPIQFPKVQLKQQGSAE